MRNFMFSCILIISCSIAYGGAYEDILNAATTDDTGSVVNLLQRGMDANTADRAGNTLLMIASRNGNLALMKSLLAARANVNRRNQHGDTALLMAAIKPEVEAARLLIEHGAELNPPGWAPLHYSMLSGSNDMAVLLIAKGAKVDAPAPNGQTALMLAVKSGKLELVQILIEAGARKDMTDSDGLTGIGLAKKLDHSDIVKYLRKVGASE